MLATLAALVFGLALLLDLINASIGVDTLFFVTLGLLLLALHQAGVGATGWRGGSWRRRRR